METFVEYLFYLLAIGSYRTYEEWKLSTIPPSLTSTTGSYRTYEEWKLKQILIHSQAIESSYRTYEEWKLSSSSSLLSS